MRPIPGKNCGLSPIGQQHRIGHDFTMNIVAVAEQDGLICLSDEVERCMGYVTA